MISVGWIIIGCAILVGVIFSLSSRGHKVPGRVNIDYDQPASPICPYTALEDHNSKRYY